MNATVIAGATLLSLVASCTPSAQKTQKIGSGQWHDIQKVQRTSTDNTGKIQARVDGHTIIGTITWRPYNPAKDSSVKTWYGDMERQPPANVVEKITLSVDGVSIAIPQSSYRPICSQWDTKNSASYLNLNRQNEKYRLTVSVGDGSGGWAGVFIFNPSTKKLLATYIEDGPTVDNQIVD